MASPDGSLVLRWRVALQLGPSRLAAAGSNRSSYPPRSGVSLRRLEPDDRASSWANDDSLLGSEPPASPVRAASIGGLEPNAAVVESTSAACLSWTIFAHPGQTTTRCLGASRLTTSFEPPCSGGLELTATLWGGVPSSEVLLEPDDCPSSWANDDSLLGGELPDSLGLSRPDRQARTERLCRGGRSFFGGPLELDDPRVVLGK